MEYSKEDLMEAKKQIWGVGENMGTEESKKIWEENAQFWDNAMGDESNEFHREVVRPKVTELLSPNPADYILDIACGNGNYSSYLAQRGASVVAFDYSKKMIELAKRRQSQYAKQIEFCVADATDRKSILELKRNRAFTKAVSNMAIMDITDIEPLLMAVYELLQESGIFVFATQHPCFVTLTEKYMTPHSYYDIAIEGQPKEQIYYHRSILIDGITGNLSGLFDNVNAKVGEIASDVGSTPQAWNSGIFNMLRSLSETVVLPIAAAILAIVMCHELIRMITEKNNMHDFDTSMFFRWIFKSAFAILIVSNTWNIVMGVFDATQSVVNQSSGVIIGETSIHFDRLIPGLEFQLESMTIGSLLSLWFQTLVVGLTMNILSICIFLVTYGRMIEIYVVTALGPIPLATMGSSEWRSTGQNYLKSLLALGFQAFLIMIVVGIYAVLIRNISGAADIAGAIWGCMGYTVLLCFCLFKTGSISKSVFGAH